MSERDKEEEIARIIKSLNELREELGHELTDDLDLDLNLDAWMTATVAKENEMSTDNGTTTTASTADDIDWIDSELAKQEFQDETGINVGNAPMEMYDIDFDKIKTVGDICVLLKAINIRFGNHHENFDEFKHLLKRSRQ